MIIIRAEYLGKTDIGVKVHSKFLANCDALTVFEQFKQQSVNKEHAPFFIDLFDEEEQTIIETIGIDEQVYSDITGEVVMSYEYYQREANYHQDLIFGAIEHGLRSREIEFPWKENESLGLSALKLQEFRKSDHVLYEINVDDLKID